MVWNSLSNRQTIKPPNTVESYSPPNFPAIEYYVYKNCALPTIQGQLWKGPGSAHHLLGACDVFKGTDNYGAGYYHLTLPHCVGMKENSIRVERQMLTYIYIYINMNTYKALLCSDGFLHASLHTHQHPHC